MKGNGKKSWAIEVKQAYMSVLGGYIWGSNSNAYDF